MYRRNPRPIYGTRQRKTCLPTEIIPCAQACPGIEVAFIQLEAMIENMQKALQQFFPAQTAMANFIANMSARAYVSPQILVRLGWRQTFKDQAFNKNNVLHRLQIKSLYIQLGADYTQDPLFKDALGLTLV